MLSENKKALVCAKLKSIVSSHFSAYNHAVEDSRAVVVSDRRNKRARGCAGVQRRIRP